MLQCNQQNVIVLYIVVWCKTIVESPILTCVGDGNGSGGAASGVSPVNSLFCLQLLMNDCSVMSCVGGGEGGRGNSG